MNTIPEIVYKNYLLVQLGYAMPYPRPYGIRLMQNKDNELIVMFQSLSSVKSTMGPAKWLDANGVAHEWKVKGHSEFKPLIGKYLCNIIGNVIRPEFAWHKPCMNPSLEYLSEVFLEFKFRAYLYDTIMEKFTHGISFKRIKSFTNNEHFEIVTKANLDGMEPCDIRDSKEIEKQFQRLANSKRYAKLFA